MLDVTVYYIIFRSKTLQQHEADKVLASLCYKTWAERDETCRRICCESQRNQVSKAVTSFVKYLLLHIHIISLHVLVTGHCSHRFH